MVWLLGGRARRLSGERLVAEAELRRAKTRFQAAFSSATSGMAMTALDGTILISNQSLSDVLRVRSDDLTGAALAFVFEVGIVIGLALAAFAIAAVVVAAT